MWTEIDSSKNYVGKSKGGALRVRHQAYACSQRLVTQQPPLDSLAWIDGLQQDAADLHFLPAAS